MKCFHPRPSSSGSKKIARTLEKNEKYTPFVQKQLEGRPGILQTHISLMERGKATVGITRAKRLAKALNSGYRVFL